MINITWTGTKQEGTRYYLTGQWFVDGILRGPIEAPANSNYELITSEVDTIAMLKQITDMEPYI